MDIVGSSQDLTRGLGVARVRSAYQQVADQLRQLIITGKLTPGDRLPSEAELGQAFGVSRSTVREALRSLTSQNLVYTSRGVNGGSFVADADPRSISAYLETSLGLLSAGGLTVDELLAVREMLEVPAARLAATERSESDLLALRTAVEQENTEAGPQHEHPQHFHILLLTCSHNSLLEVVTQPIFSVLKNRFLRGNAPATFWDQVCGDHANMVEAIERRDADAAGSLMQEHLHRLRETYLAMDRV
ncbi:FadR/GntR family transcriptional regulator [Amycolatopsis antarctica]|uniref:FadR/GntR family transcriptional regulator n=1 Tax=Amycolatopsis antarctica TaxID=1854586 RepID=UPI0013FD5884|nr:FadR/GntR family transcriptional regulator [Amycolatopsis antarctica]